MKQCIAAFRGTQCRGIQRDNFSVLAAKYQPLSENNIMERPANVRECGDKTGETTSSNSVRAADATISHP